MQYSDSATLDGLQQVVDRLASKLGRSVAIDDAQGRLVASSGHSGEEDALRIWAIIHRYSDPRVMAHFAAHGIYSWTKAGRIPPNAELQMKGRVAVPIREHGILFGHLFLIDEGVTDTEIAEAAEVTAQIGQLMYRRLALNEEGQRRAELLARGLVSPNAGDRESARRSALDDAVLVSTDPCAVLVVRVVRTSADAEALQTDLRSAIELTLRDRWRGVSLAWIRSNDAVVLLFGRAVGHAREVAEQVVAELLDRRHHVVAGLGAPGSGDGAAGASFADAALATQAAELLPELGTVVAIDSLGVYRILLKLPPDELDASRLPAELLRLLESDAADSLVETLTTYLDRGGDVTGTAAALHVHRSTLHYRLGRIEAITGADLRDGTQRLDLHLALKLRRLLDTL